MFGRSIKPINLAWVDGLREEDVEEYLKESAGVTDAPATHLTAAILPHLRRAGNYRLLADAIDLARANAEVNNVEVEPQDIQEAVELLAKVKKEKNR